MDISVVIPVYGCRKALDELHKRLTETLCKITQDYEIILVEDRCPQNSWETIEEICARDKKVKGLHMSKNFGQASAISAGVDNCSGEWVVVMDCDLQDRPEHILDLYNKAQEGYDVVFARRAQRKDSAFKIFVSGLFYRLYSWATDVKYDESLENFSISSRKVIDSYCSMREMHRAFVMYIQWMGFKRTSIVVEHHERYAGKSGYNFKKRMNMATEILTSQSDKLLRVLFRVGMAMSLAAFIAVIVIVVRHFIVHSPAGWASIVASIFLMGGLLLAGLGIVGIYVGNIFMQVKNRPLYLIEDVLNGRKEDKDE